MFLGAQVYAFRVTAVRFGVRFGRLVLSSKD